ncbi:FkbM family methyltransferase [Microbulbifer bruguierae]|uniref:FkbM family methyltransferase n=1 Tax=Microbulbifer bruguierae TaxID=3029061 RepID=A0ABY8NFC4_9GAMM|nr:FkbM family methyltransferase [Microbulbifer bruguierae]WGL17292.1 FkbM family methyltransferase [Microbulbifer bruguierae]
MVISEKNFSYLSDFLSYGFETLGEFSYGERFQDIFAAVMGLTVESPYFVDFGAMHPYNRSNTFLLEKLGWRGVIAEPNPAFKELIFDNRCAHFEPVAVSNFRGFATLQVPVGKRARATIGNEEIEGPTRKLEVPVIPLNDLLDRAGAVSSITFFSIDTEGSEWEILRSFPDIVKSCKSLCVEWGHRRSEILKLLTQWGFVRVLPEISGVDDWYIHEKFVSENFSGIYDMRILIDQTKSLLSEAELPDPGFDRLRRKSMIEKFSKLGLGRSQRSENLYSELD